MYRIARNSTIRMVKDTFKPLGSNIGYYEWDAHAEGFILPSKDLIGLMGFSCTENDQFHDITFAVVIMVMDDPGLNRATDYVDAFYKRLAALQRYPMFNDDGSEAGFEAIVFDGTAATPMSRVDFRPTIDIQVSARVTRAGH